MDAVERSDGWFDVQLAADIARIVGEERSGRQLAARMVRAAKQRDLRQLRGQLGDWSRRLTQLAELVERTQARLHDFRIPVEDGQAVQVYAQAFERSVERAGVHLEGAFPYYQAFPIEIQIDLAEEKATVNRRSLHSLDPQALAAAVVREYRRAHAGTFNAQRFMRTLAAAYDLLLAAQPERQIAVQQVSLREVYDLLVLRSGSAAYTQTEFAFDIYRLRSTSDLIHGGRKFYFGYIRKARGTIRVPTSPGNYENLAVLELQPLGVAAGD